MAERTPAQLANLTKPPVAPKGHARAAKHHGDTKNVEVIPGIEECFAMVTEGVPIREPDGSLPAAYVPLARAAAGELARYLTCEQYVEAKGMFNRHGKLNPAAEHMRKTAKGLAELLDRLGMSPRSSASLGLDLKRAQNFDLARHWQELEAKP